MTILNRRQFIQLLAGTAIATTVPLPPLPEVAPAYSPSHEMAEMARAAGRGIVQGIANGLNGLTVTDIATEAGATRYDFSFVPLRDIPDWSTQIFTVHGVRNLDSNGSQCQEEYRFLVESAEVPHGAWDDVIEFVESKLTQEHLVWADSRIF